MNLLHRVSWGLFDKASMYAGGVGVGLPGQRRTLYNGAAYALDFARGIYRTGARTNLIKQSQAVGMSPWSNAGTLNAAAAPDGTITASSINTVGQYNGPAQQISCLPNTTYTWSIWVKNVSGNTALTIQIADATNSTQHYAAATVSATWTRFSYTWTTTANTLLIQVSFQDNNTSGFGTNLFWGAQLETGGAATTYIQTTSAAVTVAAQGYTLASFPGFTYSGPTVASTAQDAAGNVINFPLRTNYVPNSTGVGATVGVIGSGGVLPSAWAVQNNANLTVTVVGQGTEYGMAYTDIRFNGTTVGATENAIDVVGGYNQIAAVQNQTWTYSQWWRISSGSLNGINAMNGQLYDRDSTGAALSTVTKLAQLTTGLQFISVTGTLYYATTAYVTQKLAFELNASTAVDFTVRVYGTQLELSAQPTPYIPTSTGAVSMAGPRITSQGILIESQGANHGLQSNQVGMQTAWTIGSGGTTVTLNAITAPDGTNTGSLIAASSGGLCYVLQNFADSIASGNAVIKSIYAKAGVASILVSERIDSSSTNASFNLLTGVATSGTTNAVATMTLCANGWYRCSVASNLGSTITSGAGWYVHQYGVGTNGDTLCFWGGQVEIANAPTSLIPTTTATVLRVVDLATIKGVTGSGYGTLTARWGPFLNSATTAAVLSYNNNSSANKIDIRGPGTSYLNSSVGPVATQVAAGTINDAVGQHYAASSFAPGALTLAVDGVNRGTATPTSTPTIQNQIQIGELDGGSSYTPNGYIQHVCLYPNAITGSALLSPNL